MHRNTWIIIAIVAVVALLLLCCCVAVFGLAAFRSTSGAGFGLGIVRARDTITRTVTVDTPATLIVRNLVGDIDVRVGSGSEVTVEAAIEARAGSSAAAQLLVDEVTVDVTGGGNEARVEVSMPTGLLNGRSLSVSLTITVPKECSVEVRNDVGELRVNGVSGSLSLSNNVGSITLSRVSLDAASEISTDVGEIAFSGSLPAEGSLTITTRVGEVRVDMPGDAVFAFDGQTDIGDIKMDFELSNREGGKRGITGNELRGDAGADPGAQLIIRTNTGGISVEAR